MTLMTSNAKEAAYAIVAYSSVAFGVAALLAVTVSLPLAYNYVSHVQLSIKNDLYHCQVKPTTRFLYKKGKQISYTE